MYSVCTLTFNPCIDKSTSIPELLPEKKLRCAAPKFEPGGGGINVARAIRKLGGEALAIYPAGGYSGKFLNELLQNENIPTHCIETKSHTRENLIVLDQSSNQQYRFGMPGPLLLEKEWQQCIDVLAKQEAEYIVVSGSLPPGLPENIIGRIASIAKKQNKKLILDASGPSLKHALEEGVYMVKPNIGEISKLYGKETITIQTASLLAKDLINKGQSRIVVVSLGAEGALLVTDDISLQFAAPPVKKLSTVGAGDSMVAGIILKLSAGWNIEKAVQYGVACGTAATMHPGTELCHVEDAEEIFNAMQEAVEV